MRRLLVFLLLAVPFFSFSQIAFVELDARNIPEPAERDTAVDKWNQGQPGFEKLPKEAREFLYWTNYARNNPDKFWQQVIGPVLATFPTLNKEDAKSLQADLIATGRLPMFNLNSALLKTSQSHADDIGKRHAPISHTSTNGTDFGARMKQAGIKNCANENISLSSQSILLSTILLYLDIGISNQGHRKTLLDPRLREIGIGAALYGKDQYFLVQDFACLQ